MIVILAGMWWTVNQSLGAGEEAREAEAQKDGDAPVLLDGKWDSPSVWLIGPHHGWRRDSIWGLYYRPY